MTDFERKIAIIGVGLATITAALFWVQLYEMTKQTQILASQSEGANAGALMDEMNTRKQLDIAQVQAKAAQDSVRTMRQQMLLGQRPWVSITKAAPHQTFVFQVGQSIRWDIAYVNSGRSPAIRMATDAGVWHGLSAVADVRVFFPNFPSFALARPLFCRALTTVIMIPPVSSTQPWRARQASELRNLPS